jgi:hypothetical protein
MKKEQLKEGWVEFSRYYCQTGFIDRWMGDSFNDPNKSAQSLMNGNNTVVYYRLNGAGQWLFAEDFISDFFPDLVNDGDVYDASEFWSLHIKDK